MKGCKWNIEELDDAKYRLILEFQTENKSTLRTLMQFAFLRKIKITQETIDMIQEIDVPEKVVNESRVAMDIALKSILSKINKELVADGFIILSKKIIGIKVTPSKELWTFKVTYEGMSSKK